MKAKHILIFATIFILSMGLGLFGPIAYENIKEWIDDTSRPGPGGEGGENLQSIFTPKKELLVSLQKKSSKPRLVVTNVDYSYTYVAKVTPAGVYTYTLSDAYGHTYTSADGKFSKVVANAEGTYELVVFSAEENAKSKPITVTGFKVRSKINKLTTAAATAAVRKGDYAKNKGAITSKMAKSCKIYRAGRLTTLQEIFISADMGNAPSAKNIQYNYLGQATRIDF